MSDLQKYKYIDIHCHLNFADYDADLDAVIERMKSAYVFGIVVGTTLETSRRAVELASKYENLYAIVGLHPIYAGGVTPGPAQKDGIGDEEELKENTAEVFDTLEFEKLANHPKVVGIGECGFDFYRCDMKTDPIAAQKTLERQMSAFNAQVELAQKTGKPLMLHMRNEMVNKGDKDNKVNESLNTASDPASNPATPSLSLNAYEMTLKILEGKNLKGNAHFYAGTIDQAKAFLDLGFSISFTGVITWVRDFDHIIKSAPAGRIFTETDSPYVAPVPNRGKRNEPTWVIPVAQKLAEIRGEKEEDFLATVREGVREMFGV